jgi:hypothetical protein
MFADRREELVVPALVIAEASYLIGRIMGAAAEGDFVDRLAESAFRFHGVDATDLRRMAELMHTYADLRLGAVDAAVIATAERLGTDRIATLDHRHFTVVRPRHVNAFTLLP